MAFFLLAFLEKSAKVALRHRYSNTIQKPYPQQPYPRVKADA
jgi:hypothetical protein